MPNFQSNLEKEQSFGDKNLSDFRLYKATVSKQCGIGIKMRHRSMNGTE